MYKKLVFLIVVIIAFNISSKVQASSATQSYIKRANSLIDLDKESIEFEQEAYKLSMDIVNFSKTEILSGNSANAIKLLTIGSRVMPWRNDITKLRKTACEDFIEVTKKIQSSKKPNCKYLKKRYDFILEFAPDSMADLNMPDSCEEKKEIEVRYVKVIEKVKENPFESVSENYEKIDINELRKRVSSFSAVQAPSAPAEYKDNQKLKLKFELERTKAINSGDGLLEVLEHLNFELFYYVFSGNKVVCDNFHIDSEMSSNSEEINISSKCKTILSLKNNRNNEIMKIFNYYNKLLNKSYGLTNGKYTVIIPIPLVNKTIEFKSSEVVSHIINKYISIMGGERDYLVDSVVLKTVTEKLNTSKVVDRLLSHRESLVKPSFAVVKSDKAMSFKERRNYLKKIGIELSWSSYLYEPFAELGYKFETKNIHFFDSNFHQNNITFSGSNLDDLSSIKSLTVAIDFESTRLIHQIVSNRVSKFIGKPVKKVGLGYGYDVSESIISKNFFQFTSGKVVFENPFIYRDFSDYYKLRYLNTEKLNWRNIVKRKKPYVEKVKPYNFSITQKIKLYLFENGYFRGTKLYDFIRNGLPELP